MATDQKKEPQKPVIVLAMHGTPPLDFPREEKAALFSLRARLKHPPPDDSDLKQRLKTLDLKMRRWPRTAKNDPFYAGSHKLAGHLCGETGWNVVVGFNEFCSPDIDEALDEAVAASPEKVIVITPMMTQGGSHSKGDIPEAIQRARKKHPTIEIIYAWPFTATDVAQFLSKQIDQFLNTQSKRENSG
ncbi:MAG: CbiX/SirB N-terminal domain-containing protein [Nitrospira sp.]